MVRIFLTYLLLLFCINLLAQNNQTLCTFNPGSPDTELSSCQKIECLYSHKQYLEALKIVEQPDNESCKTEGQALAIIGTLKANNKFDQALAFLNGLEKGILTPEQTNKTEAEILRIKASSERQSGAYLRNLVGINTQYNDLIGLEFKDSLIQLIDKPIIISYFPHMETVKGGFQFVNDTLIDHTFGDSFLSWDNYTNFGVGTVFNDSLIFFSVVPNRPYGGNNGSGYFEILCVNPATQSIIKRLSLSLKRANAEHPTFSDSTLIFSSDMEGGYGGMDLYRADFTPEGFINFKNLGPEVNSPADEIYPSAIGDTLYFSSNRMDMGFGGLDIYKVALDGGIPINAGVPINTAYNDFGTLTVGKMVKYMLSDRAGSAGGVDIYALKWAPTRIFFKQLKGRIQTDEMDLTAAVIEIRSTDGSLVQKTTVDKDGYFILPNVKGMESYEISLVDGKLPEGSKLSLYGEQGNVIKQVSMDSKGTFKFELLSPEDYFLEHIINHDESVLSVDILGMLDSDELEEGFKIYLQDSDGEVVGVATTDANGNFAFKSVKPDANYVIKSEVKDPNATIRIVNKDGKTITSIKPENGGEFAYVRLSSNDRVITLTNEAEQKVKVAESELFNIPVLYFGLDDTQLDSASKATLDRLCVLLRKNPNVSLELSGHTDSRGSASYNLKLSQKRIDAVVDYLVSKGISRDRLTGKGYGETRLLNKCSDGVACTEREHAVNRRTEIRIFEYNEP